MGIERVIEGSRSWLIRREEFFCRVNPKGINHLSLKYFFCHAHNKHPRPIYFYSSRY